MTEAQRRAYLEAMGFDIWVARPAPGAPTPIFIGPGNHTTLLLCESAEASATRIAGDIVRAIGGQPVWGWPDEGWAEGGLTLAEAVSKRRFSHVIAFGSQVERCLPARSDDPRLEPVVVTSACSLADLADRGSARREFWSQLQRGGRVRIPEQSG